MGEIVRLEGEKLDGSEVTTVPPHMVGLSEALLSENTDPRDRQGATTRKGRTQHGVNFSHAIVPSPDANLYGLKSWVRDAGTSFVVARIGTTWYDASAASWASLGIGGTAGSISRMAPLNNSLILVVDGTTIKTYDGTTFGALGGSPPSEAKYIAQFVSKIWVAGDDANPQTKSFSATNNPADWTAADDAGSITTQDGGGDTIQGLAANNKILLTFYRNFTDALYGDSTFNFREERLINRGLVSKTGYVAIGEVVFFASDDGIYMVAGSTVSDITSPRIRKSYIDISDKSLISLGVKGDLLLVVDAGSDRGYACAYKFGVWREWTGQEWLTMDTANDQTFYAGRDSGGSISQIWKLDSGTLDGASAIVANWRTGNFGFGWDDAIKNMRSVRLHAKPGMPTTTITVYKNGVSTGSTMDVTFAASGDHDWAGRAGQPSHRGHFLGMKAEWSGAGTLYGWALYAEIAIVGDTIPVEV